MSSALDKQQQQQRRRNSAASSSPSSSSNAKSRLPSSTLNATTTALTATTTSYSGHSDKSSRRILASPSQQSSTSKPPHKAGRGGGGGGGKGRQHGPGNNKIEDPRPTNDQELFDTGNIKPLVIYLSRPFKSTRGVANGKEIVELLRKYIHPRYQVVVLGHSYESQEIEKLHDSWAKTARLFARARVIIGPHGGAFNNLMWAPG
jgi:hypothetical protein